MGAWGYEPKGNDSSGDLFDDVPVGSAKAMDKIYRARRIDSWKRWERLGALQMFIEGLPAAIRFLNASTFYEAEDDIVALLGDDRWLADWKLPSEVVANLKKFSKVIKQIRSKR
jgi:hypothetical protein